MLNNKGLDFTKIPLKCEKDGSSLTLLGEISSGGEGRVFALPNSRYCAKLFYRSDTPDFLERQTIKTRRDKARRFVEKCNGGDLIAFPVDTIVDASGDFYGYIMPLVNNLHEKVNLLGMAQFSTTETDQRLRLCAQLAKVARILSQHQYALVDWNLNNFLVRRDFSLTVIDTDNFQVTDGAVIHPAVAFVPEYLPPELYLDPGSSDPSLPGNTRTGFHESWSLTAVIFHLLHGHEPFAVGIGTNEEYQNLSPNDEEQERASRIKSGILSHHLERPNFSFLHPSCAPLEMYRMFVQTLRVGASNVSRRTPAAVWDNYFETTDFGFEICRGPKRHVLTRESFQGTCPHCGY